MAEDKPASQPPEMLQHLIAARDTLLADDPDRSAPNRARMPLASALTALGAEAETKPLYESVLTDHPSHPAAAKARAEAALAADRKSVV